MKKLSIIVAIIGILGFGTFATAQMGGGIASPSFWKQIAAHVVLPTDPLATVGNAANRLAGLYVTTLDATSVVIGGAVAGALKVGGLITGYGGFTGPNYTATSTTAVNTFPLVSSTRATIPTLWSTKAYLTNTSSTNSTATNLWSTKLTSTSVSSTAIDATGYVSTTRMFAGAGSAGNPSFTFQGDKDTGIYNPGANQVGVAINGGLALGISTVQAYSAKNFNPTVSNTLDMGTAALSWKNIYASGTYMGVNMSLSGNATTSIATGRYELGRQGDIGSPFTWWHAYVAAGVAGTRNEAIMDVGDQNFLGKYFENSGTAQHPQNSKLISYVPFIQNSGWAPKYTETNALTYALTSADYRLYASTTGAAVAISLPAATSVSAGTTYEVWDRSNNAATRNITITAKGANFILNTLSNVVIKKNCGYMRLVTDGLTNWQAASSTCYGTN